MNRLTLNHVGFDYVSKEATTRVIDDLSLKVEDGEFLVILGPSGCGKTTLLRLIAGLLSPTRGNIVLSGVDASLLKAKDRRIGWVSQSVSNYSFLNVYANIALPLKADKIDLKEIEKKVEAVAKELGIEYLLGRKPKELSLGQQQKLALARAMVKDPDLYLLDEPFSAVDPSSRKELRELLKAVQKKMHATFLLVSHDSMDALSLADRVAILDQGRIIQSGIPGEVIAHPVDPDVMALMGQEGREE